MLRGEAKVRYQRAYMRRKRAGLPTRTKPKRSTVLLVQLDGKLPNLALMKISHHHRQLGDEVIFRKHVQRGKREPDYAAVYGSAIFSHSAARVTEFKANFPEAIVGGTWDTSNNVTVEQVLGIEENDRYDYSIYPGFDGSLGFTQRGWVLRGIRPYPMVFRTLPLGGAKQKLERHTLGDFQRYAIRRLYNIIPFERYDPKGGLSQHRGLQVHKASQALAGRGHGGVRP